MLASAPNNNGPACIDNHSEGDCLLRLDSVPGHAWRRMIAHCDKQRSLCRLCIDEQDPLGGVAAPQHRFQQQAID
jgi:hypothetical protein